MIQLNEIQKTFLLTACNLHWAVFQFDITDKGFEEDYGFTKKQVLDSIKDLQKQLNNL